MFIIQNHDFETVDCSQEWITFSGFSKEEMFSKDFLFFLDPEDQVRAITDRKELIDVNFNLSLLRTDTETFKSRIYRFATKTGETKYIKLIPSNHFYINNDNLLVYIDDVTELIETQNTLENSNNRTKKLLAIIGHELRLPAASLKLMLDTIENRISKNQFKNLSTTVKQLLDVIDDLRYVATPERLTEIKLEMSDPVIVVSEASRSLEGILSSAGMDLIVDLRKAHGFTCEYEAKALRHLVSNLLRNAAVHSGATKVLVQMNLLEATQHFITYNLLIEDNGTGIKAHHIPRLFEDYFRAGSINEGSGLGLAICREMANRLAGNIVYYDSNLGGAGFQLTIRLKRIAENSSTKDSFDEPNLLKDKKVLFAEDSLMIAMISERILGSSGAVVKSVSDGAEALDCFLSFDPEIIITDIFMPKIDGFELVSKLRELGYDGPIVGVTAATVGDEIDELLNAGANFVLPKPLNLKRLNKELFSFYNASANMK